MFSFEQSNVKITLIEQLYTYDDKIIFQMPRKFMNVLKPGKSYTMILCDKNIGKYNCLYCNEKHESFTFNNVKFYYHISAAEMAKCPDDKRFMVKQIFNQKFLYSEDKIKLKDFVS